MGTSGSTSASYTEGRAASDMDSTSQNDGCVFERKKKPSPFFFFGLPRYMYKRMGSSGRNQTEIKPEDLQ